MAQDYNYEAYDFTADFYQSGPPALKARLRASDSEEVRAALPETPA